jgi:hypothetical protein
MEALAKDFLNSVYEINMKLRPSINADKYSFEKGFQACHDIMAGELELCDEFKFCNAHAMIEYNKLEQSLTEAKEREERLVDNINKFLNEDNPYCEDDENMFKQTLKNLGYGDKE